MKKIVIFAAAALVALSSCSKENILGDDQNDNGGVSAFTATIEQNIDTKATLNGRTLNWENGDKISIDGFDFITEGSGASATFLGSGPTGDSHKAYFPANLYDGTTAAFPAEQTSAAGRFNMPMYAESNSYELQFKNICAVLAIKVTSADIAQVKSLRVSSNKAMSGEFTITTDAAGKYTAALASDTDKTKTATLTYDTAVTLDATGSVFYVAVPVNTYRNLQIELSADGTNYVTGMRTKAAKDIVVERNKIYDFDFAETTTITTTAGTKDCVYMPGTGNFWATMNVGATSVADDNASAYGDYYAWGEYDTYYSSLVDYFTPKRNFTTAAGNTSVTGGHQWKSYSQGAKSSFVEWTNKPYDETTRVLKASNDAATQNWGEGWRTPKVEEFQALYAACGGALKTASDYDASNPKGVYRTNPGDSIDGVTYNVYGHLFVADAAHRIFLPSAGEISYATRTNTYQGFYWSSSFHNSDPSQAYFLWITSSVVKPSNSNFRYYGFSVRPIAE